MRPPKKFTFKALSLSIKSGRPFLSIFPGDIITAPQYVDYKEVKELIGKFSLSIEQMSARNYQQISGKKNAPFQCYKIIAESKELKGN